MRRIKTRWRVLAVILAVVLGAAYYSRPVDIYTLVPGMKEPDAIDFRLQELGDGGRDYPLKSLSPEDPEWKTALEAVEALRFRRPPWNLVLSFLPKHTISGRVTHDGDLHILLFIGQREQSYTQIQFFIDEWTYLNPLPFSFANRALTLWTEDARGTGEALAEAFRPLLEET